MTAMTAGGRHSRRAILVAASIAAVVVLTRLPFLDAGYGEHGDARLIATAGRSIALTGEYTISRVPGYPQMEYLAALLWRGGPVVLNGLTALVSGIAAALFYCLLLRLGSRDAALSAVAFALAPAVYVSSVSTIDFLWTVAWILGATLAALRPRPVLAGILLGMAVGSRITSAAMVLPLALLVLRGERTQEAWRRVVLLAAAAAIVGILWYVPSLHRYGSSFFAYQPFDTSFEWMLRTFVGELWGIPAGIMLLVSVVALAVTRGRSRATSIPATSLPRWATAAFAVALIIYTLSYLRMPIKGAYLITAFPFALILHARYHPRRIFQILCVSLLLSPFVLMIHRAEAPPPYVSASAIEVRPMGKTVYLDLLRGPILADNAMRTSQLAFTERILKAARDLEDSSLVLAGWNWSSYLRSSFIHDTRPTIVEETFGFDDVRLFRPFRVGKVTFANLADSTQLRQYRERGWKILYLEQALEFNRLEHGAGIREAGGVPLLPDESRQQSEGR